MDGSSKTTKNHESIIRWVEERSGKPALVKDTQKNNSGVLRIKFPGYGKKTTLEEISWEKFFRIFNEKKLTFLYQEKTSKGQESRFFKFIRDKENK